MTELQLLFVELKKYLGNYMTEDEPKKCENLRRLCIVVDMFDKKLSERCEEMRKACYPEIYGN